MAEYISKHDAYTTLKDLEAAYIYPPVKEAYGTAARRIDQIKPADVQPVKHGYWKDIMMSEATGWDLSLTGGKDAVCETVCSVCGDCCAFGGDG